MGTALPLDHSNTSAMMGVALWLSEYGIEHMASARTLTPTMVRDYAEYEHLFLEGEVQTHIFLVVSGAVASYKVLADGRRQICAFAYPGDIVGLDSVGAYVNSAEVLCESRIRSIPINAFDNLMRTEPGFGQAMLFATASELAETREQMLSLGRKSAAEKLATFLLRIARRNQSAGGSASILSIPMKRCDIADFLGLTTETVSRTFTKFRALNIIRLNSINTVQVLDIKKLEAIADGTGAGGAL